MKLLACGILIAVGWFCGGAYADGRSRSFHELCGIILLLEAMKIGIVYARAEMREIFASFSDKALGDCGFTAVMNGQSELPVSELWAEALETLSPDWAQGSTKELLSSFGATLGTLDCASQTERIDACITVLTAERERMRSALEVKLRSYRYLGGLAGCLAAIILY